MGQIEQQTCAMAIAAVVAPLSGRHSGPRTASAARARTPNGADRVSTRISFDHEWARITDGRSPHSARSMVWQINSGALVAFRPAGDFEGCARDGAVFARWLGDGELPD